MKKEIRVEFNENGDQFVDFGFCIMSYEHDQDCCEHVYADFKQADWSDFDSKKYDTIEKLVASIEIVEQAGFRIAGLFVPCYDEQNGYYSNNLKLIFKKEMLVDITLATQPDYY